MTEQELVGILDNFAQVLKNEDLVGSKEKEINFFSATKMLTLETKHSAFFAWLLDSKNEHCLRNSVLKKLLVKLFH